VSSRLNLNPSLKLPFLLELVEPETDPDSDDLGAFKISLFFAPGFAMVRLVKLVRSECFLAR
jgi:hypothetical protein